MNPNRSPLPGWYDPPEPRNQCESCGEDVMTPYRHKDFWYCSDCLDVVLAAARKEVKGW